MVTILNNRELSIVFWFLVIAIFLLKNKDVRNSIWGILNMLGSRFFLTVFGIVFAYQIGILYLLYRCSIWDSSYSKDTILWFVGSAVIVLFKANKLKQLSAFREVIAEQLKWTVLIEFITQLFVFSFWIEFLVIPIMIVFSMMSGFIEAKSKYENMDQYSDTYKVSQFILLMISLLFVGYAIYKTVTHYSEVFTMDHFTELILPILLTLLFIPLIYCFALVMMYESLFIFLGFHITDKRELRKVKGTIVKSVFWNINRLSKVDDVITRHRLWDSQKIIQYLQTGDIQNEPVKV